MGEREGGTLDSLRSEAPASSMADGRFLRFHVVFTLQFPSASAWLWLDSIPRIDLHRGPSSCWHAPAPQKHLFTSHRSSFDYRCVRRLVEAQLTNSLRNRASRPSPDCPACLLRRDDL